MAKISGFRRGKFNPNQPRDLRGRWAKAGSKGAAKKLTAPAKLTANTKPGAGPHRGLVGKAVPDGTGYAVGKRFAVTDSLKAAQKRATPKGRVANIVPYARVSARSVTAGVNAGTSISATRRISVGGYVRIERTSQSALEKTAAEALKNANPLAKVGLQKALSKQVKLPKGATARVGTSSSGLPSVIIQKGYSRVPSSKRASAILDYNRRVLASKKIKPPKGSRPQRRNKAASSG